MITAALLLSLVAAEAGPAAPAYLGLAIGHNQGPTPQTAPLRYADDDAIRNAELLAHLGARYVLLTRPDADTKLFYPDAQARPPTLEAIEDALADLDARAAELRSTGRRVEWFIFYSGHGDVENNEGFVALEQGRLTRSKLAALVAPLHADRIHLVIDACKSYFMVFERGSEHRRRVPDGPWPSPDPGLRPDLGVLLSTSARQDSHEWEAIEAGIFSHEVRSALLGGADLDGDSRITYAEVGAFVHAANAPIPQARFRPRVHVRAPTTGDLLLDLEGFGEDRAQIGPGVESHLWLEDDRGVRVADLHPTSTTTAQLALPTRRPLFFREAGSDRSYAVEHRGPVRLADLRPERRSAGRRSAAHVAFTHVFSAPIGAAALTRYRIERFEAPAPPRGRAWVPPTLLTTGIVTAVGGATLLGLGHHERGRLDASASQVDLDGANRRIEVMNVAGGVLVGAAATALGAYLVWVLTDDDGVLR